MILQLSMHRLKELKEWLIYLPCESDKSKPFFMFRLGSTVLSLAHDRSLQPTGLPKHLGSNYACKAEHTARALFSLFSWPCYSLPLPLSLLFSSGALNN